MFGKGPGLMGDCDVKPARQEQIERIYRSALNCEPAQRESFLAETCAGDEVLRKEVDSLLACQSAPQSAAESRPSEAETKARDHDQPAEPSADAKAHPPILPAQEESPGKHAP